MFPRLELCQPWGSTGHWELSQPCRAQNCTPTPGGLISLPGCAGIVQVTLVGSKRQHWGVKISLKLLLKQELLKQFSLPI